MLASVGLIANAKKVHTIGDSTMAPYEESATVTRGWGMYFGNFLTGGWTSVNYARGGRDSRGGYNELWQNAKNNVEAGDYVLIQFAHNDEKIDGMDRDEVYNYYISQGMTSEAASLESRGTVPSTTYKSWLAKIVEEVEAKGAHAVLVGPVCRSYFNSNGTIRRNGRHDLGDKFSVLTANGILTNQSVPANDHSMDYPYHMQQLAQEKGIPYIDLTTATQQLYESYGDTRCHNELFDGEGSTHFNTTGALLVARLCAQLLQQNGILSDVINVPVDLSISPATADLGEGYKGQVATKELTLNGFTLSPSNGTITLTATDGIELSTDKQNWSQTLSVDYVNATLVQTFYARVIMNTTGLFTGTITATLGDNSVEVPLSVNVIELGGGEPFSVNWPLTSNDNATIEGNALTGNVEYNGLKKYGNNADYGILAYKDSWTAAEDDDPDTYINMSVRCPEGTTLNINNISMLVGARGGGGMKCHVYYSTDGFVTRNTLYAPTSMASNTMNEVTASPVITLEEGEELQLRVYPWYTANATGKYICVKDVVVSGQAKSAGGVEIEGTLTYPLDKGGLDQANDVTFSPEELSAGFAGKTMTAGSSLTVSGTVVYDSGTAKTTQTKIYNDTGASFAGTPTADNTLTLTLTPEDGFSFVPTHISFEGARYGTDGGKLTVSVEAGKNSETVCNNKDVNRSGKGLEITAFNYDLSNLVSTSDNPLKVNFSFLSLGKTKTMGISNLVISGTLVGSASTAVKYVLNTTVSPAEAGSITRNPDLTSYKEGSEVTLTANKNFGYRFVEWQDAQGNALASTPVYTVTMDAEKDLTAVFEQVPVYTVSTRVTNDADRTLGRITLTPNDHNNQYEAGTEITATAEESKILKFMQWTDGGENAGTSATRTLTVNGNMELVADYEVQDFIAVFDASVNNYYVYPNTSGYPFPADMTWDNNRNASSAVRKIADSSLAYTKDGGTPVVRNRDGVVLEGINGLYQNGYRTTDIAFEYQFSTVGFTAASFEAEMAAKNMASKYWKALICYDGETFEQLGETWTMTANAKHPLSLTLPTEAMGRETVKVRITGEGEEMLSDQYLFDGEFDGLDYTSHSESGVGNVFIIGTAEETEDETSPVVVSTLPTDGTTGVSATGKITITFDERIAEGDCSEAATLTCGEGTMDMAATWSNRSVSFSYMGLDYGTTYTFTLPAGFVADRWGNAAEGLTLSFTTMERQQPAARLYDAVVAQDGSGDYTSVQAAIDGAPTGRAKPWLIFVKNGRYNEHVDIPATKPWIHLIGQTREGAVVVDNKLSGGENAVHVSVGATVVVQANNTFMENITLENSYGYEQLAGPQALALNTQGDRIALNKVALLSYQDTWITSSNQRARHYIKNSLIEGAVDFIYNGGDVYLDGDTLQINRPSGGYIVAPWHTSETQWGYVFQNNVIRPRPGINVKDVWLGRPWHGTPKTVFINTQTMVNIPAKGWYNTMGGLPALWAEYNTTDANGNPVDLSQRETYYYYTDSNTGEKMEVFDVKNTLTAEEAAEYTVDNVMGGDDAWQPALMCEACKAPTVTSHLSTLSWNAVPYAICYVVTVDGIVVGFTTDTSFEAPNGTDYRVQAVNEYGGLSDYGIATEDTGISTLTPADSQNAPAVEAYYSVDGKRLAKPTRGITLRRMSDGSVQKVVK